MVASSTLKDLIILGTGVHSHEMAEIVRRINRRQPEWNLLSVIADRAHQQNVLYAGVPILSGAGALAQYSDAYLIANNEWRGKYALPQQRLATLVDPSATVMPSATLAPGCIIYPNCFVGHNAALGRCAFMLAGSIVNHDDVIGDYCVFASGATLAGSVIVGEGCYLGQSCTVRQLLTIGANSIIGMGSVVVKDVPPNCVMAGNPARVLRENNHPATVH